MAAGPILLLLAKLHGESRPDLQDFVLSFLFQTWALVTIQDHSRSPTL